MGIINSPSRRRLIILSIFVFVRGRQTILGEIKHAERSRALRDRDFAGELVERIAAGALGPQLEPVTSGGDVADRDLAGAVGESIVRSGERDHHCAHLWMNVAEDVAHARTVKADSPSAARFVESKIE